MDSAQNKDGSMDAVPQVSTWALFTAFSLTMGFFYALSHFQLPCSELPSSLRCDQLTDALGIGLLGCRALQVAAALLALTIGGHCIYAAAGHPLRVADPRPLLFGICFAVGIVLFEAGDISSFLDLLLGGEE